MEKVGIRFLELLKKETVKLNGIAEKTGFNNLLLNGKMTKFDYLIYLTNEYFLFRSLEEKMELHAQNSSIKEMLFSEIKRATIIASDIRAISGTFPDLKLKVKTTQIFENRLQEISATNPVLLLAHSYHLYTDRLSKGRIISIILKTYYQFPENILRSYHFSTMNNQENFKMTYCKQLELLSFDEETKQRFISEVNLSNIFYISLLTEVSAK